MTVRATLARIVAQEDLNFLLTNRIPRRLATNFLGWFSKIEQPLVARASIAGWRLFSDVDLADAETRRFLSMHDCFTRRLVPGARPFAVGAGMLASPSDAIVGAHGRVSDAGEVHQIKGFPYTLADLLGDAEAARPFLGGTFVTLRLTAGMYHHFHAPADLTVEQLTYISGDCWNVNPIALKRVERLFCKNERAALRCRLAPDGPAIMLVAVAAILVASIRLTFHDTTRSIRDGGPRTTPLDAKLARGEEMGWFEHGSTIVVLAPPGYEMAAGIAEGQRINAGQPLLRQFGGLIDAT
ncbi:archaetidylserine decarboxylase [Sphingomonas naphthae]|uniref:phosphatidylserine decarboxylase n=1 Tax=Sphingomonas naphthae TaxID=1813468 RepID=A0ABY7TIW7_9SPHN|nr:archaetidylserine decarboxylase [Sphingomonas naphthae]WCT72269.1 archaetidylserine decarboxylase [Sphingomonas naphthae]